MRNYSHHEGSIPTENEQCSQSTLLCSMLPSSRKMVPFITEIKSFLNFENSSMFNIRKRRWNRNLVNVCLVILILFVFHCKISSAGYVEQFLNNPDLCPPASNLPSIGFFFKEKLRLANFPNHTVVIKLSRWQDRNPILAHLNFRCTFEVTAPKGYGIMMTVRSIYLRRFTQSATCLDYIKFKPRRSSVYSPHVCGQVESSDKSDEPQRLLGPRYVYDPHAEMDVTIVTEDVSPNDPAKPLQIELVFTATRSCSINSLQSGKVKQCTIKTPNSCIPSDLFCDGYVNCGIEGDYGEDERDCIEKRPGISRAMSVFIFGMTALGTLVTVAVLILLCCFCSRKFTQNAHGSTSIQNRRDSSLDHNDISIEVERGLTSTIDRRASAPLATPDLTELPQWSGIAPKAEVEDLPPSYKELFPNSYAISR